MRYLSLFSGAGGGDLAAQHLLKWECVGYVEWEDYPQRVLQQRQLDGVLDTAPIYGDIRAFISDGYAAAYTGMVDVVTGGFPCQPFSVAGKQRGADDKRNMWPATIECIRTIRPRFAFLENVRGLVSSGYFGTVLGDLAQSGYGAQWRILSAAEVGAPHRRDRLWIVADAESARLERHWTDAGQPQITESWDRGSYVADADNTGEPSRFSKVVSQGFGGHGFGGSRHAFAIAHEQTECPCCEETYCLTTDQHWFDCEQCKQDAEEEFNGVYGWWDIEPDVGRVANGVAARVDRLKALGNGQVPLVAATAWHLLTQGEDV